MVSERHRPRRDPLEQQLYREPALLFMRYACILILASATVFAGAVLLYLPEQAPRALGPAVLALVALATWYLLARNRIRQAVYVLAGGVWTAVTAIAFFTGGVTGMAIIVYPIIIFMLGWMVGTRAAVAMTVISIAATLVFVLAEIWGALPAPPPTPPLMRWFVQSMVFVFSVVMFVYFTRSYQTRMDDLQRLDDDLRRAQSVAHVGSWVYDLVQDRMSLSAETCRIFGLPEGTTGSHDTYLARVHAEDRARVDAAWADAIARKRPLDDEHRILAGAGARWVRQIAEFEYGADGTPLRAVGTTQDVNARRESEAALRESEERFRTLLQNVPNIAVQGYALDGTTQYWNRASELLYGYSATEAVGRSLLELIIPAEMRDGVRDAIAQMAATGVPIPAGELSLQRKDGSRVPVYSSHALVHPHGREPELFCIDIDLTEQKRQEAEVLATRSQLAATLDAVPDLLFEVDQDGCIHDYRAPRRDMLALPPEAFLGRSVRELLPAEPVEVIMAALREAQAHGRSLGKQYRLHMPDGEMWYELSVSKALGDHGGTPRYIALSRDITERKRNEDEYRTIIQASIDGFWITDFSGRILDANSSICRTLGYARAELVGMNIRDIDADESPVEIAARTRDMITTGSARFQARHRRKDRGIIHVEVSVMHVAALGERLFAFVRDITERKRAEVARAEIEAQLRESQKMEALGTLAGGIAHDFNNIVATIIGNAELARQDVGPSHAALESLEEIRKASRRARDLVQQILAFGRRQVIARKVISLAPVIEESVRLLRSTLPAGIALKAACTPDAPQVLADATQVEQVLLNLCSNAWQAMQSRAQGGLIEVLLGNHVVAGLPYRGPERRLKGERVSLQPGRYACVTVRDDGPGMDPSTRSRIFEPFFTTKPPGEGTGLGLAVVHGIVRDHEASIVVQSVPGEGAIFRIYFPAAEPVGSAAPARRPVATGADGTQPLVLQGEGRHILYLDDDEAIVFLMTRLLQRQGYRVSGFTDARAALAAVNGAPAAFDLVVTDYNMPGMSGLDVAQALQQSHPDLPVALASGYISEELRAKAPAAGVRELIYKPDTTEDLCLAVARLASALPA